MNPFLSRIPLRVIWLHLILPPSRIAQHNFRLGSDGADLWNLRALTTRFFPRSPPAVGLGSIPHRLPRGLLPLFLPLAPRLKLLSIIHPSEISRPWGTPLGA